MRWGWLLTQGHGYLPNRCSTSSQAVQPSLCGSSPAQGRAPKAISKRTVPYPTDAAVTELLSTYPTTLAKNASPLPYQVPTTAVCRNQFQDVSRSFSLWCKNVRPWEGALLPADLSFWSEGQEQDLPLLLWWPCHQKNWSSHELRVMKSLTQQKEFLSDLQLCSLRYIIMFSQLEQSLFTGFETCNVFAQTPFPSLQSSKICLWLSLQ